MKKMSMVVMGMICLMITACGSMGSNILGGTGATSDAGSALGGILGTISNDGTIGNVLGSVIGLNKMSQSELYGTWKYRGPGCAFTSENLLAKAGGEVAATQIKEKLRAQYARLGITASNTIIRFNQDGTFQSKIYGKSFNGNYTYNAQTGALTMKGLLLTLSGYVTRSGSGIGVLFESKKLLTLMQTMAALSGNSAVGTIGEISKNYDGVRLGFDMNR